MTLGRTAVVVGGGLAGMAAAIRLAGDGVQVTLMESRPRLGGVAHSFVRRDIAVDNGQHVLLRCYTEYLGFLEQIGTAHLVDLQKAFNVPVLRAGSPKQHRLSRTRCLPAPLHLLASLVKYPVLTVPERYRTVRAVRLLRKLDMRQRELDERTFADWLHEHGQSDSSMHALWDLLIVAALNARSDQASLLLAAMVFQTALLTTASAADIGIPRVPLSELHGHPARKKLETLGATVELRKKVTDIRSIGEGFEISTEHGQNFAKAVVVATPHHTVDCILPRGAIPSQSLLQNLGTAPILNVHIIFDRHVAFLPFVAVIGSQLQWIFDRTETSGLCRGQYLVVSLSAAEQYIDAPTKELREMVIPELRRLFPAASQSEIVDFFVTRERHATFQQRPGTLALRPNADTQIPGLFLAGAWTNTGWPDTMEGAVRSGNRAADLAKSYLDQQTKSGGRP